MPEQCFIKRGSSPLVCGVHNVPLQKKLLPDELIASGYKPFTFLVCPVSGEVISDLETKR
jgi:hypothetical protein